MTNASSLTGVVASMGPELANHLWQSTAFAGVAAGLALALKKNQARVRYWIWMSASVKLLLPFALLVGVASHWVKPRSGTATSAHAGMVVALEGMSEPFGVPAGKAKGSAVASAADLARDDEAVPSGMPNVVAATHVSEARHGAPAFVARVIPMIPLVCGVVWLAGFVTVLVLWGVRWRRVARTMREAELLGDGREVTALRQTERAAGVGRPIELRVSESAMEPGVFGILRPVLAWPARISERLDDAQLEAVLTHEVCHVRRRDNLTAALHMFVEAVFWFHPMVWWIGARLVEERERACDEEVLQLCAQPQVYAESILKVCEFCVQSPLECVSGVTGADLKKRVVGIMTERVIRKLTWGKKLLLAAAGMLAVAVPIVLAQSKATQRMMMASALASASRPIRATVHALIAEEETPSSGEIAEMKLDAQPVSPVLVAMEPGAAGQPPAAPPVSSDVAPAIKFDVISFKPCKEGWGSASVVLPPDGDFIAYKCQPIARLLYFAFLGPQPFFMSGEPAWVDTDRYDFQAKVAPEDIPAWQKLGLHAKRVMVRGVLADVLNLKLHTDTTQHPVYHLVVAKGGTKFGAYKDGETNTLPDGRTITGRDSTWMRDGTAVYQGVKMGDIAEGLAVRVGRQVIDTTGLNELYDITLYMPLEHYDESRADAAESPIPGIFDGLKKIGLELQSAKGETGGIVIDHVERPPEN